MNWSTFNVSVDSIRSMKYFNFNRDATVIIFNLQDYYNAWANIICTVCHLRQTMQILKWAPSPSVSINFQEYKGSPSPVYIFQSAKKLKLGVHKSSCCLLHLPHSLPVIFLPLLSNPICAHKIYRGGIFLWYALCTYDKQNRVISSVLKAAVGLSKLLF